nr:hypothetical protein [Tanacetum cinerariifolium]
MCNVKKSVAKRTRHKRQYDRRMNERQMQSRKSKVVSSKALDASLVVTECNGIKSDEHITSSSSKTYITQVVDAYIRPVNDQVPSTEELKLLKNINAAREFLVLFEDKTWIWFSDNLNISDSTEVTPHYLPKVREFVFVKPNHVIASGSSRNSSKESYGSNDMAHNYYLEDAKKKTQDKIMNLKPSVMHATSLQNTTNGSKPKPRSNNQTSRSLRVPKSSRGMLNGVTLVNHSRNSSSFSDSKHFVCSTFQKCVINAIHDDCITKFLKEVNSRAKVQSHKSRNNIKPTKRIPNVNKPERWISKGYMFSPSKSSTVHEKPNTLSSCHRWKPTGRIFKTAGLRWIPTRNMFTDCTTKVDSEPPNGTNEDITNPYECDQTLNVREIQSQVTHQGAEEQIHGHQNTQFDNAPLLHNLSSDPSFKETTLQGFIPSNLHHLNQSFDTLTKLTKNHPLENLIGDPSLSILTRSQLGNLSSLAVGKSSGSENSSLAVSYSLHSTGSCIKACVYVHNWSSTSGSYNLSAPPRVLETDMIKTG